MFILSNCFHRHHSSFSYQTVWQYSNRNFPNRGAEYIHLYSPNAGIIKKCDFLPISRFFSEMMQDRAIVTMECE